MFEKQKQAPSNTELKIYPDRSHWTCIEAGWAQVGRCQLRPAQTFDCSD
ncbi:hypothetical protein [Mesorhizobium sp.]|nr:hypothetical protein [Mesorhizobium sp.]